MVRFATRWICPPSIGSSIPRASGTSDLPPVDRARTYVTHLQRASGLALCIDGQVRDSLDLPSIHRFLWRLRNLRPGFCLTNPGRSRSEEHTSELQSLRHLV